MTEAVRSGIGLLISNRVLHMVAVLLDCSFVNSEALFLPHPLQEPPQKLLDLVDCIQSGRLGPPLQQSPDFSRDAVKIWKPNEF